MIPSLSPHTPATGGTERSPLVDSLTRRVDVNGDGQATSAEFASFLSALMQSLDDEQAAERANAESATASAPAAAPATPDPATMTPAQAARALRQAFEPITRNR